MQPRDCRLLELFVVPRLSDYRSRSTLNIITGVGVIARSTARSLFGRLHRAAVVKRGKVMLANNGA